MGMGLIMGGDVDVFVGALVGTMMFWGVGLMVGGWTTGLLDGLGDGIVVGARRESEERNVDYM